ncbi:MAG: hypothetical protein ACTTKL_07125 [Treponema sp.]
MKNAYIAGLAAACLLAAVSCSTWFETKIPLDKETDSGSLSQLLTPKTRITKLGVSRQVFASQGLYKDRILVSWTAVPEAASYRLERAVVKTKNADGSWALPDESDFSPVTNYTTRTNYTDTILSNAGASNEEYGYRYYYRVQAENIGKKYDAGDFTDCKKEATRACGSLFAPVQNLTADKGKSGTAINLSWEYEGNARAFRIFRDTREDFSSASEVGTSSGNKKTYAQSVAKSDQGVEFYYKVCAENAEGNRSALSSVTMGYALKDGAPPMPSNVKTENGRGSSKSEIKVTWNEIHAQSGSTITYSVYRTSSEDSVYSCIAKNIASNVTSFTDKTALKTGAYYYYYVQATAQKNGTEEILKSAFSESGPKSASPAVGFLLSPPNALEIIDSSDKNEAHVDIVWQPAVGSEAPYNIQYKYNIYYSETADGTYTSLQSNVDGEKLDGGRLTYKNADKKNFYKISSVNSAGTDTESALSMTAAPMPAAPVDVTATKTEKLSADFAYNDYGVYPVKITWKAAAGSNPAGYNVFRSAKPDSSFRKLNDAPLTATEFIDKNESAKAGAYYFYKVVSLNSLGQGNKGNDPANDAEKTSWGYGALTGEQWFREYNKSIKRSQAKLTLMHKPSNTDKLGSESKNGDVQGSVSYNARVAGFGGAVTIHYSTYADFYVFGGKEFGEFNKRYFGDESKFPRTFVLDGNTDTSADISANGSMHGTVKCSGMYPGEAVYNHITIKGGAAGGGHYVVTTKDAKGSVVLENVNVTWTAGEE